MIFSNLRPGTYQLKVKNNRLTYPEGNRTAKTPEEGRELAQKLAVVSEANYALRQMEILSNGVASLDDSHLDLNHTDKNTIVLHNAPLEDEGKTDALGIPAVKGFLNANIHGVNGRVSFREKDIDEEILFETSQPAPNMGLLSRTAPNSNPMIIAIDMDTGTADVTIRHNPSLQR